MTLTDLVTFRPTPPTLATEPDHVGIAGLPLNLVAAAPPQTLHGELFDHDVSVRFTPHHFTWTYGDGTTSTTTTPGRSWTQRGDAQFTPTPTSHVYAERGTYTAAVTVSYSPVVTFDTGQTQAVAGYVTSTSAEQSLRILEARTALVAYTCTEDPTGPGC
ncbi:hypothetical protein GH740_13215 [Microbacterium sp. SYP-A9085]|uniref:hypothetical protein n=1 Tax=Microbacterium sp. SYP-A9085 TaxID=2664454 RepID=UPI00129A1C34|nr:hypothetical protein [Microbacterium sp. SYP-A9085]MRH30260.1 hypothetical protein [Microbacterium sp. SYP-A9085]